MQKRTEITIDTERFLVVSRRRERTALWCHRCAGTVLMLTVEEAARISGNSPLVISTWAEAGRVHFAATPEGQFFICSSSLAAQRQELPERTDS
jgi:hypothetical protein